MRLIPLPRGLTLCPHFTQEPGNKNMGGSRKKPQKRFKGRETEPRRRGSRRQVAPPPLSTALGFQGGTAQGRSPGLQVPCTKEREPGAGGKPPGSVAVRLKSQKSLLWVAFEVRMSRDDAYLRKASLCRIGLPQSHLPLPTPSTSGAFWAPGALMAPGTGARRLRLLSPPSCVARPPSTRPGPGSNGPRLGGARKGQTCEIYATGNLKGENQPARRESFGREGTSQAHTEHTRKTGGPHASRTGR